MEPSAMAESRLYTAAPETANGKRHKSTMAAMHGSRLSSKELEQDSCEKPDLTFSHPAPAGL
jgi:hypothetical protein